MTFHALVVSSPAFDFELNFILAHCDIFEFIKNHINLVAFVLIDILNQKIVYREEN